MVVLFLRAGGAQEAEFTQPSSHLPAASTYMNPGSIGFHLVMQTRPFMHALYAVPVRQAGTLPAGFISFPRHPASFGFRLATDTLAFG